MRALGRMSLPAPQTLPRQQSYKTVASQIWTPYSGNPILTSAIDEFEVVLQGGTYYAFGNTTGQADSGTSGCYGWTASSLSGTWTPINSGAMLFDGHYPTVIYDGGTWRAWANYNLTLHYFTASSPSGTWTDNGVAISPPGSGPYSDWIFDPCVRKMPDTTYMMMAGSYYLGGPGTSGSAGNIGYWTSPSGNNGTWTLARFPLLDASEDWEGPRRSDGAPLITSAGELVVTYTTYPTQVGLSGAGGGGMAIFDSTLGGWVMRETPLIPPANMPSGAGALGNPVIYEFSTDVFTLMWADGITAELCYATASSGNPPYAQRNWDGTTEP